jgi:predicted MFS family arabinose efflux permease
MGMFTLPMSIDWFDYALLLRHWIVSLCLVMGMFTLFTFIDRLGYALSLKRSLVGRLVFDDGHVY